MCLAKNKIFNVKEDQKIKKIEEKIWICKAQKKEVD